MLNLFVLNISKMLPQTTYVSCLVMISSFVKIFIGTLRFEKKTLVAATQNSIPKTANNHMLSNIPVISQFSTKKSQRLIVPLN